MCVRSVRRFARGAGHPPCLGREQHFQHRTERQRPLGSGGRGHGLGSPSDRGEDCSKCRLGSPSQGQVPMPDGKPATSMMRYGSQQDKVAWDVRPVRLRVEVHLRRDGRRPRADRPGRPIAQAGVHRGRRSDGHRSGPKRDLQLQHTWAGRADFERPTLLPPSHVPHPPTGLFRAHTVGERCQTDTAKADGNATHRNTCSPWTAATCTATSTCFAWTALR